MAHERQPGLWKNSSMGGPGVALHSRPGSSATRGVWSTGPAWENGCVLGAKMERKGASWRWQYLSGR